MATSYASELLIRISADSSLAESNLQNFRQSFSRDLSALAASANQATQQMGGGLSTADKTAQTLADHFGVSLGTVSLLLEHNRQTAQVWKTQLVANLLEVLDTSQNLEASFTQIFMRFDSALGSNIANALIWQKSIGEAFQKAAIQAISSIAQEALVRAIYSSALGFYMLAIQDYSGAALAFESAAIYGAVGGTASLAGRALAGSSAGTSQAGASTRSSANAVPRSGASNSGASEAALSAPQKIVQVIFQGPVYGGQAGVDELVRHITQAVTERDVNLVAYTVVRQPAPRA